jgi:hypothetical protein
MGHKRRGQVAKDYRCITALRNDMSRMERSDEDQIAQLLGPCRAGNSEKEVKKLRERNRGPLIKNR